jgi:hypothetical protein
MKWRYSYPQDIQECYCHIYHSTLLGKQTRMANIHAKAPKEYRTQVVQSVLNQSD